MMDTLTAIQTAVQTHTWQELLELVKATVTAEVAQHPAHICIEVLFALAIIFMVIAPKKHKVRAVDDDKPTPAEEKEMIATFASAPFNVPTLIDPEWQPPVVAQYDGPHAVVGDKKVLNAATFDFLGLATDDQIIEVAGDTIVEYGVGSCGPRGFYGTLKPHLECEHDIATFLGTQASIIYSSAFATTSTLIPCYSSRGDEILCDEGCNLVIQQGCRLSRASVTYYRHCDMAHLEELMQASHAKQRRTKVLPRRWIVTEGVFRNTGDVAPLPDIVRLAKAYKYRITLDDMIGFGVMGPTGRGTHEHFGVSLDDITVYVGALSTALGSVGGFCAGSDMMVDHQRLAATGYVFSASLPSYSTACASKALAMLSAEKGVRPLKVQANATALRAALGKKDTLPAALALVQSPGPVGAKSPLVLLRATESSPLEYPKVAARLRAVSDVLLRDHDVMLVAFESTHEERVPVAPALRIAVKSGMTAADIQHIASCVSAVTKRML
jgi:serine palmitoyltransferase